ncbi:MAG: hypothetical protein ABI921_13805, partial [Panacibacter sp.]
MKKLLIISACICFAVITKATIRTVCNMPSPSAQFSTIQSAVDSSSTGDTVLVQGSGTPYASFVIADKRLVVIGPGWRPLRNLPQLTADLQNCTITGPASSGTEIQGLTFRDGYNYGLNIQAGVTINSIRVIRNHFLKSVQIGASGTGNYTGYLFEGNWFDGASIVAGAYGGNNYSNFIIQNNIFYNGALVQFVKASNMLLDHNLFYYSGLYYPFGTNGNYPCKNFTIQNNIFCRAEPVYGTSGVGGAVNCIFKNNITFNTNATSPWTLNGNIDGGGNVLNQDPLMAAQTQVNSGVDDPLLSFIITSGPANNKGTDGKDMGLL